MKNLINCIKEGLKITSKTKVDTEKRDLSNVDFEFITNTLYFDSIKERTKYIKKMGDYQNKGKSPSYFNKEKSSNELLRYWYSAIMAGWIDCSIEIRNELNRRVSASEDEIFADELDAYILDKYKNNSAFTDEEKLNIEKYLRALNVKYN